MTNSKISGRILQLFEAKEGKQIYRLRIQGAKGFSAQALEVVDEDDRFLRVEPIVWGTLQGSCDNRGELYVSFRLDAQIERFSVRWDGVTIAKMSPYKKELMIRQRDRRMVNPAIDEAYGEWLTGHKPVSQDPHRLEKKPLVSIVAPLFNTPPAYLREMIDSVFAQTYENWELVLVNASPDNEEMQAILSELEDERVRIIALAENYGIAGNTNKGIEASRGEYVGFLDHDDTIDHCLLEKYLEAISENAEIDLLYCDEDNFTTTDAGYYAPLFKPDFNLDLLYSHNYIVHLLMVSRRVLGLVDLSPDEVSGAQDYDLTLKAAERARAIKHVPEILYHWRAHPGSTNGGQMESKPYAVAAGARALEAHFDRRGLRASASPSHIPCVYEVGFAGGEELSVAVVLLFRCEADSRRFLAALFAHEGEQFDRCIVVGAFSEEFEAFVRERYGEKVACVCVDPGVGDVERIRIAAGEARSDLVAFCSDSVVIEKAGTLAQLRGLFSRSEVGVVSPKMLHPDGLVQYAGAFLREDGSAGYLNQNFTNDMGGGYLGLAECLCDYDLASPDFFMAWRSDLDNEVSLDLSAKGVEDFVVRFCAKTRSQGKVVAVCPQAVAVNAVSPFVESDCSLGASRESILWHPSVDYSSLYPRLKIDRSFVFENVRLFVKSLLKGRL